MTQIDIAALVADREAGTKGPWVPMGPPTAGFMAVKAQPAFMRGFTKWICNLEGIELDTAEREANARRIARVPDMEAALIAQDAELKRYREALVEIDNAPGPDHWVPQFQHLKDIARAALGEKP